MDKLISGLSEKRLFNIAFSLIVGEGNWMERDYYNILLEDKLYIRVSDDNPIKLQNHDNYNGEKAEFLFRALIEHNPNYPFYWFGLAICRGHIPYYDAWYIGDQDEIIELLSKAIQLLDDHPTFYYYRAIAFRHKEEYENSIEDYEKTIFLDDKYVDAYIDLAWIYRFSKNDYKNAIEVISRLIEIFPNEHKYFSKRADISLEFRKYSNAIQDYSTAITKSRAAQYDMNSIEGNECGNLFNIAVCKEKIGDFSGALSDVESVLWACEYYSPQFIDSARSLKDKLSKVVITP